MIDEIEIEIEIIEKDIDMKTKSAIPYNIDY